MHRNNILSSKSCTICFNNFLLSVRQFQMFSHFLERAEFKKATNFPNNFVNVFAILCELASNFN